MIMSNLTNEFIVALLLVCDPSILWKSFNMVGMPSSSTLKNIFFKPLIVNIFGFQIEVEIIFNITGVTTSVCQSRFLSENWSCLVMTVNNWPNGTHVGCGFNKEDFICDFIVCEETLLEDNEIMIQGKDYFEDVA